MTILKWLARAWPYIFIAVAPLGLATGFGLAASSCVARAHRRFFALNRAFQGQTYSGRLSWVWTLRSVAVLQSQLRHVAVLMHGLSLFIDLASVEQHAIAAYPADANGFLSGCHGQPPNANHLTAQSLHNFIRSGTVPYAYFVRCRTV